MKSILQIVLILAVIPVIFSCNEDMWDALTHVDTPANLRLAPHDSSLVLSWDDVFDATSYEVLLGQSSDITAAELQGGGDITDNTYTITGLTNGITYYLWVRAKDGDFVSEYSSVSGMPRHAVGDTGPAGGIVFRVTYIAGVLTVFEAATINAGGLDGEPWSPDVNSITTGTAEGTGSGNTTTICNTVSAVNESTYAALQCNNYSTSNNGVSFDDWFLPSRDELTALYSNRGIAGLNMSAGAYWSSSESDITGQTGMAYCRNFSDGAVITAAKSEIYLVRPVRMFTYQ